jgi:hypothetical protein
MPKSASTYITDTLIRGLGAKRIFITVGVFPDDLILFDRIQTLAGGCQVAQQHFGPSRTNLAYLKKFRVPLILHVRDPRSVILSWTHHLSSMEGGMDELFWYYPAICPPPEFLTRDFPWRLQWCIENHLQHFVDWLKTWCEALDSGDVQGHITTYEQFLANRQSFFDGILRYAGISQSDFRDPQTSPGKEHLFRAGVPDEWRQVMDATTAKRVTDALTHYLAGRFGW